MIATPARNLATMAAASAGAATTSAAAALGGRISRQLAGLVPSSLSHSPSRTPPPVVAVGVPQTPGCEAAAAAGAEAVAATATPGWLYGTDAACVRHGASRSGPLGREASDGNGDSSCSGAGLSAGGDGSYVNGGSRRAALAGPDAAVSYAPSMPPRATELPAAANSGLLTRLPYTHGNKRNRGNHCGEHWRSEGARGGLLAHHLQHHHHHHHHHGVWAAAPPSPLPFAVRQLHGIGGGGDDVGGDRHGRVMGDLEDVGRTSSQPYRAAPREEGLGTPMDVFDRQLKSLHRDRSAALLDGSDPLLGAVSERLLDRLEDCRRTFPTAVVLGGAAIPVLHQLAGGRGGIERVVVVDTSQQMLDRVKREEREARSLEAAGGKPWPRVLTVRGDEEHLPLQPNSVDLIISCLGLHWANDLPGAMAQCRMALRPDGLFLGALLGGETLQELRISCALAQMERQGGVSAVVSPLAQVRDAGNLLTRADLRLPAVDMDRFRIGYPSPLELVQHLRALGESNAAVRRRRSLSRDSALAAAAVYQSMFGSPEEEGGGVSATFEVIFVTGWAPSAHQPRAAKRGSATLSFQELADGLVGGGAAVGGTAEDGVLTPPPPPPPRQPE